MALDQAHFHDDLNRLHQDWGKASITAHLRELHGYEDTSACDPFEEHILCHTPKEEAPARAFYGFEREVPPDAAYVVNVSFHDCSIIRYERDWPAVVDAIAERRDDEEPPVDVSVVRVR